MPVVYSEENIVEHHSTLVVPDPVRGGYKNIENWRDPHGARRFQLPEMMSTVPCPPPRDDNSQSKGTPQVTLDSASNDGKLAPWQFHGMTARSASSNLQIELSITPKTY